MFIDALRFITRELEVLRVVVLQHTSRYFDNGCNSKIILINQPFEAVYTKKRIKSLKMSRNIANRVSIITRVYLCRSVEPCRTRIDVNTTLDFDQWSRNISRVPADIQTGSVAEVNFGGRPTFPFGTRGHLRDSARVRITLTSRMVGRL